MSLSASAIAGGAIVPVRPLIRSFAFGTPAQHDVAGEEALVLATLPLCRRSGPALAAAPVRRTEAAPLAPRFGRLRFTECLRLERAQAVLIVADAIGARRLRGRGSLARVEPAAQADRRSA